MNVIRFTKPLLIAAAVAGAFAAGQHVNGVPNATAASVATVAAPTARQSSSLPDFSALVEANAPTVVQISVTKRMSSTPAQFDEDGPMGDMLRRFGVPRPDGAPQGREGQGVGSGFIVGDGLILTNAHVVDGASELTVRLADKREFKGTVVGTDRLTDVAVVRVDAKNLPAVRVGNPAQLKVGEWVAAIGSPFGLDNSVTAGIVSAKSRALPQETLVPFIQTDVAVNPGQLGRAAVQHGGRSRRHQLADLFHQRRLHGAVVRDPDRPRPEGKGRPGRARQGHAWPHRRRYPVSERPAGRDLRTGQAARRTGQQSRARLAGEQGWTEGRRRCRRVRRPADRRMPATCRPSWPARAPARKSP